MKDGVVKTYFNGAITQNQIISIIIAIVLVALILAFVKKVAKLVLSVAVIVIALVYFGVVSPEQLQDVSKVVSEQGQGVFTQIADTSKNVKVDTADGLKVQVYINDTWVDVDDISSFVKTDNGTYSVIINGDTYPVSDDGVQRVLDILKK